MRPQSKELDFNDKNFKKENKNNKKYSKNKNINFDNHNLNRSPNGRIHCLKCNVSYDEFTIRLCKMKDGHRICLECKQPIVNLICVKKK